VFASPRARFSRTFIVLLILGTLSACATAPKPLTGLVPGKEVDTIQSSLAISMKAGEHSSGGRGYLIFKYPDRFHLAVLSPFGLTVLDLFSDGERLTCLVPARQTAYRGLLTELPETGRLSSLGLLKWVVARTPARQAGAGAGEIVTAEGDRIFFDGDGLVSRKLSPKGEEVKYSGYRNVNGIAFAETLEIANSYGATVRIVFDDPELNAPVDNSVLTPNLEGITVLPLSEFKSL